ncbi:MAG: GTPase Era [Anaerovibrio sp.]|nr:GTPase Era [Anaerovibrio sp.]MBR2143750.1 GTPase Era [Anaerovibrio sp.]
MQLPLAQAPDVVKGKGVEIDINSIPVNESKQLPKDYRSGFVAVIGRPNVGKSTLINSLIGQKIAIMSDKPQTTRNRIMCVLTKPDMQMIFLDTPGIHKPIDKLGEYMVKAAEGTLQEVDAIIFVVDAKEKFGAGEHYILERLRATKKPVVLAINKVDLLEDKEALLPIITSYNSKYDFAATVPISALEENNLEGLLAEIKQYLPKGPQYYPEDMVTDQPERLIIAEMVREKVLHLTRDEVPHSIAVDVDEMKLRDNGDNYVRATIYVERDSQKGIIIGKKGAMLKDIGAQARQDIQMLLGGKVFLDLWVKVKKDWRNRDSILKGFGFE